MLERDYTFPPCDLLPRIIYIWETKLHVPGTGNENEFLWQKLTVPADKFKGSPNYSFECPYIFID